MATKIWDNFGLGINRGGLQSPQGSMESINNMLPFAGYAEVAKGKTPITINFGNMKPGTPDAEKIWSALGRVGTQNLCKCNGIVSNISTIGNNTFLFPLWDRRTGAYPKAGEVFTGYKSDVFFSSMLPPDATVVGVATVDRLVRWGGYVLFGTMSREDRESLYTGRTNAAPNVVTTTNKHNLATGERVTIEDVQFTITVIDDYNFSLDFSVVYGTPPATSGTYYPYTVWQLDSGLMASPLGVAAAKAALMPGFRMYYGVVEAPELYNWVSSTIIREVKNDGGTITVKTDYVENPFSIDRYCISNVDPVGIPMPTSPVHRVDSGVGTLAAGDYRWCFRYVSSSLGIAGNPSPPSGLITLAANRKADVTAIYTPGDRIPYWVDKVEFYRSYRASSGDPFSLWYLVGVVNVAPAVGITTLQNYQVKITDDGSVDTTTAATLDDPDYWNDRPSTLFNARVYNNRMYAIKGSSQNTFKFSTDGNMDAWPVDIVNAQTTTEALRWQGGEAVVGDALPIQAIVPEGGSWSNTGQRGDNLLIMKRTRSWRWYGVTWDDFALNDAFSIGTRDGKSVVNCGGVVCFVAADHAMWVPSGGMHPEPFTKTIWPNGYHAYKPGLTFPPPSAIPDLYWGAYWSHYYILSANQEQQTYFFDIDKGFASTQVDFAPCFSSFYGTFDRLVGAGYSTNLTNGAVTAIAPAYYFDKTNGTVFSLKSQPESLPGNGVMTLTGGKALKSFWVYAKNATGVQQTMTLSLYADGSSIATTVAVTIPTSAAKIYHCILVRVPAGFQPTLFQWALSGTVYAGVSIEWVLCEYEYLTPKTQI